MDIKKLNKCSLLEEVKPLTILSQLAINTRIPILEAKTVKTKFGETVLLEFEKTKAFLPKRVLPLMKVHIHEFVDAKYSIIYEGLREVGRPSMGVKFRLMENPNNHSEVGDKDSSSCSSIIEYN